jgi:DNA gyrase/topoisomerase IV subunit B
MQTNEPRNFDLNIEKILEGWKVKHAIREVIANALDEQVLSHTQDIIISTDRSGNWHIRDFGPGIHYENLTQNENPES